MVLIKPPGVFKGSYGDAAVTDPEHVTDQEHTLAQVCRPICSNLQVCATINSLPGYSSLSYPLDGGKLFYQADHAFLLPPHIRRPRIQHLQLGTHWAFGHLVRVRDTFMAALLRQES